MRPKLAQNKPVQKRILVKIGGAALKDDSALGSLAEALADIKAKGWSLIVVHGGGPAINRELSVSGLSWEFVDGQRQTTPEMIPFIEKALCGSVNRMVTKALRACGVNALGLSAADGAMLECRKFDPRLGEVGQVQSVNTDIIESLLALDMVPVIAPLGSGPEGQVLNLNADWGASHLAVAIGAHRLLFATDQAGILDSTGVLLPELNARDMRHLINDGIVNGGMLTKTHAILHALDHGIAHVQILKPQPELPDCGFNFQSGTLCLPDQTHTAAGDLSCTTLSHF